MERLDETKRLNSLTALALGKTAHLEDMVGVVLPEAKRLAEDTRRAREAAGLELDED